MAIHKSRASETARLIAHVVSGTTVEAEAATARLIVLGARSVPHVRTALAAAHVGHDDAMTARLLDILSQVSPAAAVDAAAGGGEAVGPLHAASAVDAWHAALDTGDRALSTRALDHLTALALDATAAPAVRRRALDALRASAPDVVAPLVARVGVELEDDGSAPAPGATPREIDELPVDTDADLEGVRVRLSAEGDTATLSALHRVVSTLRRAEHARPASRQPPVAQVRTLVHQVLARRQSTVALYDLRDSFERDPAPLPVGMFAAIAAIGDPESLEALAVAWVRMPDEWARAHLADAAGAIIARHGLGPRHASMKRARARCRALFEAVSTPSRSTPSPPRARRT